MSKINNLISGGKVNDPVSVEEYVKTGGFDSLKKAAAMGSEDIITEIKKAKLLGRGGAAYPAGSKWEHLLHIPEHQNI